MGNKQNGDMNSIFKTLGVGEKEREENDYYATDPEAAELLLEIENFSNDIWEPACGEGHLSEVFIKAGHNVTSTDLIDRGYGKGNVDFLSEDIKHWYGDIITNPPYKYASEFVEKSLDIINEGNKVAMFLKVQFLEGKKRKELFKKYPPKTVWVSSSRILCAKNADFEGMKRGGGSAVAFAWFVWEKGFIGTTELKWFN